MALNTIKELPQYTDSIKTPCVKLAQGDLLQMKGVIAYESSNLL